MLRRDLWHLRGQILAAALVVACGVAALVATRGTYESLVAAQEAYYAQNRFAEVFARVKRAPESLAEAIRRIPGVAQVRTRIVADVTLDVPGLSEPATGRLVSIPQRRVPVVNDLQLVRGEWVTPGASDEVLASEAFARANGLDLGSRVGAIVNGRWRELTIVGIALSPEFVYEIGPGMLFPDNRRFGVLWMAREALAPAFDMTGAFNDLVLTLAWGAREREVVAALDGLLARYGGLAAHGREDQLSHRILTDELGEIRITTTFVPTLFLGVAAFLLYVVLSRLVAIQRTEIGLLKAFGHTDLRVGVHYLSFAVSTVAIGLALGLPLGAWLGELFVGVYRRYFHFPELAFSLTPGVLVVAAGVSLAAAAVGALSATRRAIALPPAEAMRAAPPTSFRAGLVGWIVLARRMPASARMIARNLARKPLKALLSMLGIALAVGLMVVGRFGLDAVKHMMAVQFERVQRDDVTVLFGAPRGPQVAHEVAGLAGVLRAEPFRVVPVWLRHEHRARRVELFGLSPDDQMRHLLDAGLRRVALPPEGVVLGRRLVEVLGIAPGDALTIEVLEGARAVRRVVVAGVVDEYLGLGAYMDSRALARLLGEGDTVSGARLRVRADRAPALYAQLKQMPAVAGVSVAAAMQRGLRDTLDRSFWFFSAIQTVFAGVIVAGMVYNSLRIALSERGNELASLGVLGFSRREVALLLVGEQAVLTLVAIPLGLAIGYGLAALLVPVFDRDMFRVPLVIAPATYAYAATSALVAAVLSSWLVARRVRRLDLIAVLKTRE